MSRRGSTLVELMVTVALFAAMLTLILGFYVYAQKASQTYDRNTQIFQDAMLLMNKLEGNLNGVVTFKVYSTDRREEPPVYRELHYTRQSAVAPIDPSRRTYQVEPVAFRLRTEVIPPAGEIVTDQARDEIANAGIVVLEEHRTGAVERSTQLARLPGGVQLRFRVRNNSIALRLRVRDSLKRYHLFEHNVYTNYGPP